MITKLQEHFASTTPPPYKRTKMGSTPNQLHKKRYLFNYWFARCVLFFKEFCLNRRQFLFFGREEKFIYAHSAGLLSKTDYRLKHSSGASRTHHFKPGLFSSWVRYSQSHCVFDWTTHIVYEMRGLTRSRFSLPKLLLRGERTGSLITSLAFSDVYKPSLGSMESDQNNSHYHHYCWRPQLAKPLVLKEDGLNCAYQ